LSDALTNITTVELLKPGKGQTVRYAGCLLKRRGAHLLVHARWDRAALDLGYVTFEPGDHFFEHHYLDRHYNIFELRAEDGRLKGWYCNVCRPAVLEQGVLRSEDLELDAFVPPDRRGLLVLDEDEFKARALDDGTKAAALAAFAELRDLAAAGAPPFASTEALLSLG
jgi:hypothetical protein